MFDPPDRAVVALADEGLRLPDTFTLHAILHRLCASQATALDNCLDRPAWDEVAATVTARTRLLDWSPDLCRQLGIGEGCGGYERIDCAAALEVADTPIGRLVTPICLDFCGEEIRELVIESRVNLFLVPAMTPRIGDFRRRARELGTLCRGTSFVVNSAWLLARIGRLSDERLVLGYLPEKRRDPRRPQRLSEDLRLFSIGVQSEDG